MQLQRIKYLAGHTTVTAPWTHHAFPLQARLSTADYVKLHANSVDEAHLHPPVPRGIRSRCCANENSTGRSVIVTFSNSPSNMSTKAVVRINEMPPEMAEEAFIHGMDALETQFNESDMAAYVKEKFEERAKY